MKVWNKMNYVEVEIITIEGTGQGNFIYYAMDDNLNTYVLHRNEICTLKEHAEERDRRVRNLRGFDPAWF